MFESLVGLLYFGSSFLLTVLLLAPALVMLVVCILYFACDVIRYFGRRILW